MQKAHLHYVYLTKSNHISIAVFKSPEWMVAYNRFNFNLIFRVTVVVGCDCRIPPIKAVTSNEDTAAEQEQPSEA